MLFRVITVGVYLMIGTLGCSAMSPGPAPERPESFYQLSGGTNTGPLELRRMELTFSNDRGEITVPFDSRLRATAIIRFDGSGLFRATWVLDGREIETVVINIVFGDTLKLSMKKGMHLPTFDPGPHQLTLKIQDPATALTLPVITYFVTLE